MVRHNNEIPHQHFHKDWDKRVKTWFNQPAQKKIRRDRRKEKAAAIAPRPVSGDLKPVVHCPTRKYNSKVKLGRGFSLAELAAAKISAKVAPTIGISVDHRRTNKSQETLDANVKRLVEYKNKLVVFPKRSGKKAVKKGDTPNSAKKELGQSKADVNALPAAEPAVTTGAVTEEMKEFKAYATLRHARNEARLFGLRIKKKKAEAEKDD